jgi:hypothetical protein
MIANIFAVREYIRYLRTLSSRGCPERTTRVPTRLNTVIETERLVLQVPRADDLDDLVELMTARRRSRRSAVSKPVPILPAKTKLLPS